MAIFTAIAASAWWSTTVVATIGASAAGAIIAVGQAATWSLASAALSRRKVTDQQVKAVINQTDQPRIRAYGRNLLGGVRAFYETRGGVLHQLVVINHGRVDELLGFLVDGKRVSLDAAGNVQDAPHRPDMSLFFRDGAGQGGDYPLLKAAFPELWTDDHRLQGQATFHSRMYNPGPKKFSQRWPRGPNTTIQAEVRGTRVRDLTGARIYSENAALIIRDFLTDPDGWDFPLSKLDGANSWPTFTAICAGDVPLKNGGTEPRYRLCGFYALDEQLKDVTGRMLATCDGQLYETADGKIGILGGAWSEPDVTITSDDILSFSLRDGFEPLETYNILKGSFVSPAHAYQPTEVREREDSAALAREEARTEHLELDMCPSGTQLQRLMKIKMAKDRRDRVGTIRTNLVGMKARWPRGDGIHTIRLDAPEFDLVGVFEVTSHVFSVPRGFCEIGIASIANPYPWNPATEETALPLNYSSIPTPNNTIGNPANAVLAQERVLISSGVYGVQVAVWVDDPGREDLWLGAEIAQGTIADVENDGGADWVEMTGGRLRAVSGILADNTTWTVRIRWESRTDWVRAGSITVTANAAKPAAPRSFSGLAVGGRVSLDWINAASDYFRTQIWRGTSNNIATATLIQTVAGVAGQVSGYDDTPDLTGAVYYWTRTINGSGVQSDPAGPVSVTL